MPVRQLASYRSSIERFLPYPSGMISRNVATVIVSVIVAIIALEIILRIAGIAYLEIYRLDPVLGWSPRPLAKSSASPNSPAPIEINGAGFRDRDHAVAKSDEVFRIVVLGDSFVEGREVGFDDLFWQITQRELETCQPRGKRPEILGFGINGYGTAQELLVLREHALKYQPDLVLLAFFTGNDVANNSAELDGHPERPYFELRDDELVLNRNNLDSIEFRIERWWSNLGQSVYNHLRSAQVLRQLYLTNKLRRKYLDLTVADQLVADLNREIYQPPETEQWIRAWQISEALISRMKREANAAGADFWLVLMTNPAQVYPDQRVRIDVATPTVFKDLMYPDRRLNGFAALLEIPLIGLAAPLRTFAERNQALLHGSADFAGGHWNKKGHAVAGREIARRLCDAYGTERSIERREPVTDE
jgi:lysophospholipase L1-like esterase